MTIEKLLESLRKQRESINISISLIEQAVNGHNHVEKRKAIIKSLPELKRKKKRRWSKQQRARFMATLAAKGR